MLMYSNIPLLRIILPQLLFRRPGMWAEVYGAQQPVQALAAAAGVAANVLLALSARLAPRSAAWQEEAPEVVA